MSRNIFEAIRSDKLEEVTIRLNLGEDIDQSFPPRYETPLHVAVRQNNCQLVTLLCERGASLSLADGDGMTPLALANKLSLADIVLLLSSAGASSTPSQAVRCPERPDLMLAQSPPWDPDCEQAETEDTSAALSSQAEKSEEKFTAEILLQKLKLDITKFFPRRQSKKFSRPRELITPPEGTKYFHSKFKNIKRSFYKLLMGKKSKEKSNENKFSKIYLENPDGKTMKLYTFRKED